MLNLFNARAFYLQMEAVAASLDTRIAAAKAGDPAAWDALFQRYQMPLFVYARELLGDREESFDVVQETFIRALRHIRSLRDDKSFAHWLFSIAHQLCLRQWRKNKGRIWTEIDESLPSAEPEPDERLEAHERFDHLREGLAQLTPPHRAVLLLHFIEEFSVEEMAGILKTSPGTVKSRLHYAKRALREILDAHENSA